MDKYLKMINDLAMSDKSLAEIDLELRTQAQAVMTREPLETPVAVYLYFTKSLQDARQDGYTKGCDDGYEHGLRSRAEGRSMWSNDLMCRWISWSIEWDGFLRLDLPEDNCCDMRGAIKIAEAICPMVYRIDVYVGDKLDITYSQANSKAKWEAIDRSVRVTAKAQ